MAKVQVSKESAEQKTIADHDIKMKALALEREAMLEEIRIKEERNNAEIAIKRASAAVDADIEKDRMEADRKNKQDTLAFDQECRAKDDEAKRQEKGEAAEASAVPAIVEALKKITTDFAAALNKPKTIDLGSIKRDAAGHISGATARTH